MTRQHKSLRVGAGRRVLALAAALALALTPLAAPGQQRPGGGGAQDPAPPAPKAVPAPQAESVAFLGTTRPVLLRVHVQVDGKSVRGLHEAYAQQWLRHLDRNNDDLLTPEEARFVPGPQMLQLLRANGLFFGGPPNAFVPFEQLDTDRDGKVSVTELAAHFERSGFPAFQLIGAGGPPQGLIRAGGGVVMQPQPVANTSDAISEVLFKHLDPKGKGNLTRDSVRQAADGILRKFDANDDEILQANELLGSSGLPVGFGGGADFVVGRPGPPPTVRSFSLARSQETDEALAQQLLTQFDKDRDGRLTREEGGFDTATFRRLDTNADGVLDAQELSRWHRGPADLEIVIRFGKRGADEKGLDLARRDAPAPAAGSVTQTDDAVRLSVGDAQVNLRQTPPPPAGMVRSNSQLFLDQFRAADVDNKGYVEANNLPPRLRFLQPTVGLVDRDGDGKVTLAEMTAFTTLMDGARLHAVTLAVGEHGRALFKLLDVNGDGRLSLRELRTAWDRLAPLDKNGDGIVTPDEIARQFEVTIAQGAGFAGPRGEPVLIRPGMDPRGAVRAPARGPLWFQKMDLNGEGDLTPREFLGTRADFDRIDTDRDGLISAEEAERYDASLRPAQPQRRDPPARPR